MMDAHFRRWSLAVGLIVLLSLPPACSTGEALEVATRNQDPGRKVDAERSASAPDFSLSTIEGETIRLSDTSGQVRLIDFWATWCAPCRDEVPMLNELQAVYADRGFRVLAISDEEAGLIREFVDEYDVAYTNLIGTEEVIEAYGVLGLPAAYLLDGEGRVVETFLGPKPRAELVRKIEALLDPTPST